MKYLIAIVCSFAFFAGSRAQACDNIGVACGSFAQVQSFAYAPVAVQSFAVQQYAVPVQAFATVAYSPVVVQQAVVANHYGVAAVRSFRPIRAAVRVSTAPVRVLRQRAVVQKQVVRQRSVIVNGY